LEFHSNPLLFGYQNENRTLEKSYFFDKENEKPTEKKQNGEDGICTFVIERKAMRL
jgi:hypothetical protein